MSKRMLINYLLLILIVIFTWIGIEYPIREDQMIDRDAITTLKPQNIERIKIETADANIELVKQQLVWKISQPIQWFANNIAAERLASLASMHPQSKLPRSEIDLSTLGLRIPKAVVTLNDTAIYFGNTNRIGNRRYVMVDPNVFLVSDIHYPFISQGLNGLVDERLLPSSLPLQSLQSPSFNIIRYEQGFIEQSSQNRKQAAALIDNWQRLAASRITAYTGQSTPQQKITASLLDGREAEFYVLSIKPEIIIARPDLKLAYHFPEHQYYNLLALEKPDA